KEFPGVTWGGKVGNTIIRTFKYWTDSLTDWLEERLINFAVGTMIGFEQSYAKISLKLVNKMLKMKELPEELKPFLVEAKEPKSEAGAAILSSIGGAAVSGMAGTALTSPLRTFSYWANWLAPTLMVSPEEAILADKRGKTVKEGLDFLLRSYGYDTEHQELKKLALKAVLGLAEVRDLTLRGEITEIGALERIEHLGFDRETAKELRILFKMIPTVDDAILGERRGELLHSEALKVAAAAGMTSTYYGLRYAITSEILSLDLIRTL
ncbi:unnamed protein product, partial [marine sediment metagenome]